MNEESVRAAHMQQAYHKSLQATVKKCSHPDTIEQSLTFKLPVDKVLNVSNILAESIQKWADDCTPILESVTTEFDLKTKFLQLEKQSTQSASQDTPSDASALIVSHTNSLKQELLQQMKHELFTLQSENSETIERLRLEGASMQRRAERVCQQKALMEEAFSQSASFGVQDMDSLVDRMAHQSAANYGIVIKQ